MRLCASCRFTSLKFTVFTNQYIPQSTVRIKHGGKIGGILHFGTSAKVLKLGV
jgi:hypothetical protein